MKTKCKANVHETRCIIDKLDIIIVKEKLV